MQSGLIRGLATADLHLGIDNVGGPNEYGLPQRVDDFFAALDEMFSIAVAEKVDLFVIAGDLTRHRNPPQRIVAPFLYRVRELIQRGITVVLVRGNHDGDSGAGQSNLLDTAELLGPRVVTFNEPASCSLPLESARVRLIGIPWPRLGRSDPRPLDELAAAGDQALRETIGKLAWPAPSDDGEPQLLIGHLAVAGADRASDQWMTLGYEPMITPGAFPTNLDLVVLGHYHKPSIIQRAGPPMIYCGSPVTIDFGEQDQEKYAWLFTLDPSAQPGGRCLELRPALMAGRPWRTLDVELGEASRPEDATAGVIQTIGLLGPVQLQGAVVRVRINCQAPEQASALRLDEIDTVLRLAGVWYVASIAVNGPRMERRWAGDAGALAERPPDELLRDYLEQTEPDQDRRTRLYGLATELMERGE